MEFTHIVLNSTLIHLAPKDVIFPLVNHIQNMIRVNREYHQKFYYQEETNDDREALMDCNEDYVAHYRPRIELPSSYEHFPVDKLTSPWINRFCDNKTKYVFPDGRIPYHYYNSLPEDIYELYMKEKDQYESCTGSIRKFSDPTNKELVPASPDFSTRKLNRKRELVPPSSNSKRIKKALINLVD